MDALIVYGISILSIVLGFIALLAQKTYINPETNEPSEVEIPFIGKIKTNYPAVIFVFLGFAAALHAFNKSEPQFPLTGKVISRGASSVHEVRFQVSADPWMSKSIPSTGTINETVPLVIDEPRITITAPGYKYSGKPYTLNVSNGDTSIGEVDIGPLEVPDLSPQENLPPSQRQGNDQAVGSKRNY